MPTLHKRRRRLTRALGLAAFLGVAATGVAVARAERQRRAYTAEEARARLHEKHRELDR